MTKYIHTRNVSVVQPHGRCFRMLASPSASNIRYLMCQMVLAAAAAAPAAAAAAATAKHRLRGGVLVSMWERGSTNRKLKTKKYLY